MKHKLSNLFITCFLISLVAITPKAFSQSRLPDGTIIYKDGTKHLPNGTVVYPNGTVIFKDGSRHYPKGTNGNTGVNKTMDDILHPNKNNTVYDNRRPGRNNNGQWLPPGQAKKRYGGQAKDYAPGHNKGRGNWNKRDDDDDQGDHEHGDHEHGNGKSHGHGHDKDD